MVSVCEVGSEQFRYVARRVSASAVVNVCDGVVWCCYVCVLFVVL